jgi:hypothetical protein
MTWFFLQSFPKTGIHVVTTLLHAHLQGRKLRLRHFRNGVELPPIAEVGSLSRNKSEGSNIRKNFAVYEFLHFVKRMATTTSIISKVGSSKMK